MCQIRRRSERNQSSTLLAKIFPKVRYIPGAKSFTTPSRSMDTPPTRRINRIMALKAIGPPWAPVISCTMDWGPCSSMASRTASATSVMASSQEIRFQRPEPRSPTRLMGYWIRSLE